MTQVKIKRVYDPEERSDGFRVLVDKLWPRGIKKEDLHYDLWAKDITPSAELRKWFHEDVEKNWEGFSALYQKELSSSDAVKAFVANIKDKTVVTLLYASKDAVHNHALILKEFLEKSLAKS